MKRFRIEVTGTHRETDLRSFDRVCEDLLTSLPPAGFRVLSSNFDFDRPDEEEAAEPARRLLGFSLFDPRPLTVAEVKAHVRTIDNIDVLHAGAGLERAHSKYDGGRVKVLGHIESRIQQLIG